METDLPGSAQRWVNLWCRDDTEGSDDDLDGSTRISVLEYTILRGSLGINARVYVGLSL